MNNQHIYTLVERLFPVMAEYDFACHVWFSAGKHDQKARSAYFSRQRVKSSKVCRMRYTQHTNQTKCHSFVLIKQLIFYLKIKRMLLVPRL